MSEGLVVASIATAVAGGTAVLIAATGELLVETTGVYNIGIEGVMLVGALMGFIGTSWGGSVLVGLAVAIGSGACVACLFGVLTVLLRGDMVITGIAVYLAALGVTGELGESYVRTTAAATIPDWHIPVLSTLPVVGPALFQQSVLVYVAVALPVAVWFLLNRTRHGLSLIAIGEDPASADALGVPVLRYRMFYVIVGGGLAGLAGASLTLGSIQSWLFNVTSGQGWIAFAIVIFAGWRPLNLIAGAFLFGLLGTVGNVGQALGWNVPPEIFSALPYIGTLAVLAVLAAARVRKQGKAPWPAALGQPFFREG